MRSAYWWLPNLVDFSVTSESTLQYNCLAWALGDDSRWIDPTGENAYWPEGVSDDDTVDSVIDLFRLVGYELCEDGSLEAGYEKIAVYAVNGSPTHAARQLEDGRWTSKLGKYEDIVHATPEELQWDDDKGYGQVAAFMVRPVDGS